jgi:hypothetical protein
MDAWVWWWTPVIPALRRSRQGYREFEANLVYLERPCLKQNKTKMEKRKKVHKIYGTPSSKEIIKKILVGCWWLMLAILAIQDAEIRRTVV